MHLVDSSTLYAILLGEPTGAWALAKLNELRDVGGVFINQIVHASSGFPWRVLPCSPASIVGMDQS
jgi:hypothetical protein